MLEKQDSFGYPITLTHKGSAYYRSPLGGILSIIIKLIILAYFVYQLRSVFIRDKINVRISKHANYEHDPSLNLTLDNFNVAFRLFHEYDETLAPWFSQAEIDRYFSIKFYRHDIYYHDDWIDPVTHSSRVSINTLLP